MATIADLRRKINTAIYNIKTQIPAKVAESMACLLYTSDAADE